MYIEDDYKIDAMNYKKQFKEISEKLIDIFKDTDYINKLNDFLNEYEDIKSREQICIAIVGGWSTGKSTIIKALTGDKSIEIGSGITTHEASRYNYSGVTIIDTPGLLSRNDNDTKIARTEINKADIVVFCISNESGGPEVINEFRKIIENKNNYDKIILVVNKFDREKIEDIYLPQKAIEKINAIEDEFSDNGIDLFSLNISVRVFSALKYIQGCEKNDHDIIALSMFGEFINEINEIGENEPILIKKCQKEGKLFLEFIKEISSDIERKRLDNNQTADKQIKKLFFNLDSVHEDATCEVKELYKECRNALYEKLDEINKCNDIQEFCNELNDVVLNELEIITDKAKAKVDKMYRPFCELIKERIRCDCKLDNLSEIKLNGKFKKTPKIDIDLQSFDKWFQSSVEKVVHMSKPVITGHTWKGLKRIKTYSDAAGKGTKLHNFISKMKIFGSKTDTVSKGLGKTADFLGKHSGKISIGFTVIDVGLKIAKEYNDSTNISKIERQKNEWRNEIKKQVYTCQNKLLKYEEQYKNELLTKLEDNINIEYASDFEKKIISLRHDINDLCIKLNLFQEEKNV